MLTIRTPIGIDYKISDNTKEEDEAEAAVRIKQIADSIFPGMFTVIVDTPSIHTDNKMTILDLKVWVGDDGTIHHQHYSKEVSYKGIVWAYSGLSKS